jgi:hypothetical protein
MTSAVAPYEGYVDPQMETAKAALVMAKKHHCSRTAL